MIKEGSTTWYKNQLLWDPSVQDFYPAEVPVDVSWRYESSEYGNGSLDEEFEILLAETRDEKEVELDQDSQDRLFEQLKSEGEFAGR